MTDRKGSRLNKKQIAWIRLLQQLKREYMANFDLSLTEALTLAGIPISGVDPRLLSIPYVRQPTETGEHRISIGFLRYGGFGTTTRKVMEDVAQSNRLCGTLHVGLCIAQHNPVVETEIKILMLGTLVHLSDASTGWAPCLTLGPGVRKLEMVYRSPMNNQMKWSTLTQHLAYQIL